MQTDEQSKRTIEALKHMLWDCIIAFIECWDSYLHLDELSFNNSYHASIGMPPFKLLNGWKFLDPGMSGRGWTESHGEDGYSAQDDGAYTGGQIEAADGP